MILETIKDQEYHKKILLANDSYAEIERKEGIRDSHDLIFSACVAGFFHCI